MPTTTLLEKTTTPNLAASVPESKLDALTSLRFFAALMIFMCHAFQMFGLYEKSGTEVLALWQGVSFFFVLSGFILAYVYPSLDKPDASDRFLLARFARIWPTHFAAFLLTLALVPSALQIPNVLLVALANLSMVHAWCFNPAVENSFNAASWTISIELFFYLCFPFLIKDFNAERKTRWIAASLLSVACVGLSMVPFVIQIPGCSFAASLFINTNPLCRLLEFTLGIAVCRFFQVHGLPKSISRTKATILEVCTLLCIVGAVSIPIIWPTQSALGAWSVLRIWAMHIGGAPFYTALILLMASQRGRVAEFLTKRLFVKLGEISFSLYMFHLSIIYSLLQFREAFSNLPIFVLPVVAFTISIIVAHLNYTLIETPFRRRIVGLMQKGDRLTVTDPTKSSAQQGSAHNDNRPNPGSVQLAQTPNFGKKWLRLGAFATEFIILFLIVGWLNVQFRFIPNGVADRIVSHSVPTTRDIEFGDKFRLLGLKLSKKSDGLHFDAVWKSLAAQELSCFNSIQIIDAGGKTLSTKMCAQDTSHRHVSAGQVWEDKFCIETNEFGNGLKLGLQLCDPKGKPLTANKGILDGSGTRLLVALP
jgi:peptidoglycan/LPS O-acetylase OafA/YrhL